MTAVFHRSLGGDMPLAVGGDGIFLIDAQGKRYLDACGGAAVSCLGHSDADVRAALHRQIDALAFAHTGFFTSEPTEALADDLVAHAPKGDDRSLTKVWFTSGGSEAVESALKMARQYFLEIGQPGRRHFIARRQSYHGNTLGALGVGGNVWRREPFSPLLTPATHIAPCYAYRDQGSDETAEAYGLCVANELEAAIEAQEPGSVAAFVAETVVGATAGALAPVPGYFRRIREICDRHGVLLILDEVMCGMGRTGTLHACEQDGIVPDLLCAAKGLGAGYQPIGCVLVNETVFEAIRNGSGGFQHGHTYQGHPMAAAAALAVQRAIRDRGLLENVTTMGERLQAALEARFGQNAHVGDIRGRGLFRALELVADRETKTPFDPAFGLHKKIKAEAMARGLMCYPGGGTMDGERGDHILLAPPFIITDADITMIVDRLDAALTAALDQLPKA
ncbi:MAG: aspartate aminotransferase family protein [Magnetovibrionaceae bacterium]